MLLDIKKYQEDVKGPGKFEGEKRYSVYYYEILMGGNCEETIRFPDGGTYWLFAVTPSERRTFGIESDYVIGHEDDNGFWYCEPTSRHTWERLDDECRRAESESDGE